MTITRLLTIRALFTLLVLIAVAPVFAQTATFTYQGRLTDGGTAANGVYDLQFALFDNASSGGQIGSNQTVPSVSVSSGVFTVSLDFGAGAFNGATRFLEISTRPAGGASFTLLTPRQEITSTPYAIRSLVTNTADGLSSACAGCVQDANINGVAGSKVSGTIPVAGVPAGSASYIQNTSTAQSSSNFNISGTGTANVLTAVTQYNIGGNRVLSIAGTFNTFGGAGTGVNNTGADNSFFGASAGNANAAGESNSFFGSSAGLKNTTGGNNTFVGTLAGGSNTTGTDNAFFGTNAGLNSSGGANAFFGSKAGRANTTGIFNSFFGTATGFSNTTGSSNAFFGNSAGFDNQNGVDNSFFGVNAGNNNSSGSYNSFIGAGTGTTNKTGSSNTLIGFIADVGSGDLTHATAIGAGAVVNNSNTIVLGRDDGSDFVRIPGLLTIPNLAVAGSTQLCRNSFDRVGTCSSSLRYKTNLAAYRSGLNIVNRLRPISFTWKDGGMRDLGFGAEDVEKIDPLLVTYNKQGLVEGVKYDRINVVLVNAVKEQQNEIERQRVEALKQQDQIKALQTVNAALNGRLALVERAMLKISKGRRAGRRSTK